MAKGIRPIIGIEFRQNHQLLYTGIARNREGFRELCEWLSIHSMGEEEIPVYAPEFKHCWVIYDRPVKNLMDLRANEFIGIRPSQVSQLGRPGLPQQLHKAVLYNPVVFWDQDGFRTHKLLRCIDLNIVLSKLSTQDHCFSEQRFFAPDEIQKKFARFPEILARTQRLLESCSMRMEGTTLHNRQTFTGSASGDQHLLQKLAVGGCRQRFGPHHRQAMERTQRELQVIFDLGFAPYFLITWDVVRYAHSAGYHHVGRGSGANSLVAYCINITDVDPLELDLYFERFINPHRTSPPDFDIDFSWDERDDVLNYIFHRYGHGHTALLATYNTFKGKSIVRELGKVFGLPKRDIDLIVQEPLAVDKHHPFANHIFKYGKRLEGFPNYLSIHAGGIVISEQPLYYHTALQLMPKGFPITHFDMYGAEDRGFHKFDILSQRGLGHIKDAVDLIRRNRGTMIDIHDVTRIKQDEQVRQQLRSAHCIGCFYIESPAMRGLLTKLRCDNYIHLVAASSIIRPGVAKSGMMREYIHRFQDPGRIQYLHPVFEKNLSETYGVMVYQEDVMKIVHHFAGLNLNESDVLRRIMTGKKKSSDTFRQLRDKYFRNCRSKGYSEELTKEVWRQIESFSGYSFCKAHSASFAVESFQSLYLKTYFPLEFMVAVINNFGGFYDTEYYVHEAHMQGARIHPPCINRSEYLTSIRQDHIYIGFVHIRALDEKVAKKLVAERASYGPYKDFDDFMTRLDISREPLELLIRIGAFRSSGLSKYELMWKKNAALHAAGQPSSNPVLFKDPEVETFELPALPSDPLEQAFDEIELLGFPLCSPFDLLRTSFRGDILASQMGTHIGRSVKMVGYFVTLKNVTTVKGRLMNFGTWLDAEGKFFDTVHFPPILAKYPFKGKGCYLIQGNIAEDFGFPSLEVIRMAILPFVKDPRY